jgi:hypothetical protein
VHAKDNPRCFILRTFRLLHLRIVRVAAAQMFLHRDAELRVRRDASIVRCFTIP